MATIINNPTPGVSNATPVDREDRGMGFVVGLILAILLLVLLFAYGLPALRGTRTGNDAAPSANINVPEQVDVNVNRQ
jgi:hypothetical protein